MALRMVEDLSGMDPRRVMGLKLPEEQSSKESVLSVRREPVLVDGSMVAEITDPPEQLLKEILEMVSSSGDS